MRSSRSSLARASWLVNAVALVTAAVALGCKRPSPPAPALDASAPSVVNVTAEPSVRSSAPNDAGSKFPIRPRELDASAAPVVAASPLPVLPVASDTLEVVAIGRSFNSKILWLQELGSRVWLSGVNLDAYADGDGALVKGPDLLAKFPYQQGVHDMRVVGAYPHLYAMRTKHVNGRMESPEPTLFVYAPEAGGPGTWAQAKPLGISWYPIAFLAHREGALVVTGQVEGNAAPYYSPPGPGTSFTYLAPDGSLSDPKLGVHPLFMAWGASSDRSTLSLIGTIATPPKANAKDEGYGISGIHVARVSGDGAKLVAVQRNLGVSFDAYGAHVHEAGGTVLVVPSPSPYMEEGWKPDPLTVFLVTDDKPRPRRIAGNESCALVDAHLVGDVVYAIRRCFSETMLEDVVRVAADGKTEKLALPRLVKKEGGGFRVAATPAEKAKGFACAAVSMVVRAPDDVWVTGKCGEGGAYDSPAIPVVLRRGRPQEPVLLP